MSYDPVEIEQVYHSITSIVDNITVIRNKDGKIEISLQEEQDWDGKTVYDDLCILTLSRKQAISLMKHLYPLVHPEPEPPAM